MSTPKRTGGGNAFPCSFDSETLAMCQALNNTPETAEELAAKMTGMTRRQWYAGLAMQALITKLPVIDQTGELGIKVPDKIQFNRDVAGSAWQLADALLETEDEA